MTLAELQSLDFARLWSSLPAQVQVAIGTGCLINAIAQVVVDDDGTDASPADKDVAADMLDAAFQSIWTTIDKALPEYLAPDLTALHGLDDGMQDEKGRVEIKGVRGYRKLYSSRSRHEGFVHIGGAEVEIGGFKNVAEPGQPPRWEAWTLDQIEAERLRRHPEAKGNIVAIAP